MATITRGYNFGVNELVTPTKLHLLVDKAVATDLDLADSFAVEAASPASIGTGKMMAILEQLGTSGDSTYSGVASLTNYLIRDDFYGGWVAFFKPLGMETRRFVGGGDLANYAAGAPAIAEVSQGAGATLLIGSQGVGIAGGGAPQNIFGSIGSETIAQDAAGRINLIGFAPMHAPAHPIGTPWPANLYMDGNSNQWAASSHTNLDGVYANRISAFSSSQFAARHHAWLFGSPIFRS